MPRRNVSLYPTQSKGYLIKKDWEYRLQNARKRAWNVRMGKGWIYSFQKIQAVPNHLIKEWMVSLRKKASTKPWPISLRWTVRAAQLELWLIAKKYIHPTRERDCWGLSDYLTLVKNEINKELEQFY